VPAKVIDGNGHTEEYCMFKMAIAKQAVIKKREGLDSYAEEGIPDEVEREAVAGDEKEGDLGVRGWQAAVPPPPPPSALLR
jgi:hypothetical protein